MEQWWYSKNQKCDGVAAGCTRKWGPLGSLAEGCRSSLRGHCLQQSSVHNIAIAWVLEVCLLLRCQQMLECSCERHPPAACVPSLLCKSLPATWQPICQWCAIQATVALALEKRTQLSDAQDNGINLCKWKFQAYHVQRWWKSTSLHMVSIESHSIGTLFACSFLNPVQHELFFPLHQWKKISCSKTGMSETGCDLHVY